MSEYSISEIKKSDARGQRAMTCLLLKEGIDIDKNLDYSLGLFDEDYNLVATGSCYKNTLRCMAVDSSHQGEGLLNQVVTALISFQYEQGNKDLFLYTKCDSARFFGDLGFYEIARIPDRVVFMENRKNGFSHYLDELSVQKVPGRCAAIVMNANPFTKGHRYLVEKASRENDHLHLFVISEDVSLIPFDVRFRLVKEGVSDLKNITLHKTGSYIISNATFPSYFLKDSDTVISSHAKLDAVVFSKIAQALSITKRYVGTEPFSRVTALYNDTLKEVLPLSGVEVTEVDRAKSSDKEISASDVRLALKNGDFNVLKELLPASSYDYFVSEEAALVIEKIKASADVKHY